MSELAEKSCVPCQGGVPSLPQGEIDRFLGQVHGDWHIEKGHHLTRHIKRPDFKTALDLVHRIGEIAEREGHHPDLYLSWGKVGVEIWTHKIDGLTESDFVLAAKIDELV